MLLLKNKSMNEKRYNALIVYLHNCCDMVSFLVPDYDYAEGIDYEANIQPFMEAIQPFIVSHYRSGEYCNRLTGGTYNIYHMAFDKNIIGPLCLGLHLYNWMYPNLPEDLCFYKKGKCFLKSVAHEKLCWIYAEEEDEKRALKKIGLKFIELPFGEVPSL